MLEIRRDRDIHAEDGGWFQARWHFSFDRYRDPQRMGLGPLRVFNDDRLVAGAVWPLHPHRDVEGITYVVEGRFRHEDSVGGGGELEPHAVQRMTLGSGALHSEQNASETEPMRFLQFWILPDTPGLDPEVEQRQFSRVDLTDRLRRVLGPAAPPVGASAAARPEGDDVVRVHQDASASVGVLSPGTELSYEVAEGRGAYLYLMDGEASLDDEKVSTGDAAVLHGPHHLDIAAIGEAHLIVVDVPLSWEPVGIWAGR